MNGPHLRRRLLYSGVLALGVLLLLEVFARLTMGLLASDRRFDFTPVHERQAEMKTVLRELLDSQGDALVLLDDDLGWVYRPGYRGELYSSNSIGARGTREYSPKPADGTLRIAAFGDSFVHANELPDDESWSAQLEAFDPRIEVLNFGVGGYGTDQALLSYERRGEEQEPQVVVLGFAETDYARNVNRFRRFLAVHELPLFKPRFLLSGDSREPLVLLRNAFPNADSMEILLDDPAEAKRSADRDWFYQSFVWSNPFYDSIGLVRLAASVASDAWRTRLRPDGLYRDGAFNTDSEAFAVLVAIVDRFAALAASRGQQFVLMIFPTRDEDIWRDGPKAYQPLLEAVDHRFTVLDLADALRADPAVTPGNLRKIVHYGPEANRIVARAVLQLVIEHGWLPKPPSTADRGR